MEHNNRLVWRELGHHLPFSIFSVCIGLMSVGVLTFIADILNVADMSSSSAKLFHVFHPAHMFFSTVATTAMFWQHERRVLKTIIIGIVGSIGVCGISDIFIPYVSGILLGAHMEMHICIIQHPQIIIPFVVAGLLVGFLAPGTLEKQEGVIFSHSIHVFVSSMASILYLVSYGMTDWIHQIGAVFIYMILAVVIPCCTSDIVFPLLLVRKKGMHQER